MALFLGLFFYDGVGGPSPQVLELASSVLERNGSVGNSMKRGTKSGHRKDLGCKKATFKVNELEAGEKQTRT